MSTNDRSKGRLVTFEGLDGTGKTTQIQLLASVLERSGLEIVVTREPGGTRLGEELRAIMLDSRRENIGPNAELALFFASRAELLREVIDPALKAGRWVLCDRFIDSTEAYQGGGRGLGPEVVWTLHKLLGNNCQPWMTVLLDGDLEVSLARALRRNNVGKGIDEGRFEAESVAFYQRVHLGFRQVAAREPHRVVSIDARQSVNAIHEKILFALYGRLCAEMTSLCSSARQLMLIRLIQLPALSCGPQWLLAARPGGFLKQPDKHETASSRPQYRWVRARVRPGPPPHDQGRIRLNGSWVSMQPGLLSIVNG